MQFTGRQMELLEMEVALRKATLAIEVSQKLIREVPEDNRYKKEALQLLELVRIQNHYAINRTQEEIEKA